MNWEYKEVIDWVDAKPRKLEYLEGRVHELTTLRLNELGDQGWELVSCVKLAGFGDYLKGQQCSAVLLYTFKRPNRR